MRPFTKSVYIKYICNNCHDWYWRRSEILPTLICDTQQIIEQVINEYADVNPTCKKCNEPHMNVASVECAEYNELLDAIGSISYGEWTCATCAKANIPILHKIYPGRIRMAREDITTCFTDDLPYKQIVSMGLPWKCPTCKNRLQYTEPRYKPWHG